MPFPALIRRSSGRRWRAVLSGVMVLVLLLVSALPVSAAPCDDEHGTLPTAPLTAALADDETSSDAAPADKAVVHHGPNCHHSQAVRHDPAPFAAALSYGPAVHGRTAEQYAYALFPSPPPKPPRA